MSRVCTVNRASTDLSVVVSRVEDEEGDMPTAVAFKPADVPISTIPSEAPIITRRVHRCSVKGCRRIHATVRVINGVTHVMV
jgi:hypothetical protein